MRLSLLALSLLLALPLAGCETENRVDGGNSEQTNADDYEFDRGQTETEQPILDTEAGADTALPDTLLGPTPDTP